jgi:hypothetical protein
MKILLVWGDDDYGALTFENAHDSSPEGLKKFEQKLIEAGGVYSEESDEGQFNAKIYEFEEIEPKFIEFVRNEIQDYDDSKHKNFYLMQ